ncbi:hypothetical protein [Vibrio harveyi]|uniref:hypothetical protein n=1 Tax=Vibrio harveyi TaxID=669 RepID=UPI003CF60067
MILGNILSAIGAVFLLLGYFYISAKGDEKRGFLFSGIGSTFMGFAFFLFESPAFLVLNIIWTGISIHGYMNRNKKQAKSKVPRLPQGPFILNLGGLVVIELACLIMGNFELLSWLSITLFLSSYALLAFSIINRGHYIFFSLAGNAILIPYLVHLGNYSSVVQTIISIGLSMYALRKIIESKSNLSESSM